ncbi:MAG: [citrate (pro-3S)-lyase] ligase [Oscillospiraceae bacterium]
MGTACPGRAVRAIARFLSEQDFCSDSGVQATVSLQESGRILACGGLDGNVIKTVAVDPAYQGQGLAEVLMTELRREAFSRGHRQLFDIYQAQQRAALPESQLFPVVACGEAMLLESTRGTAPVLPDAAPKHGGNCGAVVMNCAPFTLGHQYLVDQARQACDWLYVFVLSEAKGMFPPEDRLELVRQGCQAYSNVSVHPTMGYLISNATFPTYFLKDQNRGGEISCQLDLEIFASRFAPALGLRKRFVGTEPLDPVTGRYNEALQSFLPGRGISVVEVPRLEAEGGPVSASRVRGCLASGDWQLLQQLVPHTTFAYLKSKLGG